VHDFLHVYTHWTLVLSLIQKTHPFGQPFVRLNIRSAKRSVGQTSVRPNVRRPNVRRPTVQKPIPFLLLCSLHIYLLLWICVCCCCFYAFHKRNAYCDRVG